MRRRVVVVVAIAAAFTVVAPAAAKDAIYEGAIDGASESYFATVYAALKKGEATRVTRVSWNGIAGTCSNGSAITLSGSAYADGKGAKVKNRKFAFDAAAEDATGREIATYRVKGKFAKGAKSVEGSIDQTQENFGGAVECEGSAGFAATIK